jgi:hypothetical protein
MTLDQCVALLVEIAKSEPPDALKQTDYHVTNYLLFMKSTGPAPFNSQDLREELSLAFQAKTTLLFNSLSGQILEVIANGPVKATPPAT